MNTVATALLVALLALLVERLTGYPRLLQRTIRHPVQWMGALIAYCDRWLNRPHWSPVRQVLAGAGSMILLMGLFGSTAWWLAQWLPWWVQALLATSLLAQKSLKEHVQAIIDALPPSPDGDLQPARRALSMIVGRDTGSFDENRIAHASIESLAENASDGIIAPLFWLLVAGLPGMVVYKAVNTADSMIGHLDARHRHFGKVAARLDDVLNYLPARITALLYAAAAALFMQRQAGMRSLRTAWRDAHKHVSPNAGWPEAAMAGALNIRLGGPRSYQGRLVDFPWLGDGRSELSRTDLRKALALHQRMLWLPALLLLMAWMLVMIV